MKSIKYIQDEVKRIGSELCGDSKPKWLFKVPDKPTHDGSPHVEVIGDEYHYVVTERGSEFERKRTKDIDELLFWLVSGDVFELACDWELEHRIEHQDSRRLMFAKEIEYLEKINSNWASKQKLNHENILKENPYNDGI